MHTISKGMNYRQSQLKLLIHSIVSEEVKGQLYYPMSEPLTIDIQNFTIHYWCLEVKLKKKDCRILEISTYLIISPWTTDVIQVYLYLHCGLETFNLGNYKDLF